MWHEDTTKRAKSDHIEGDGITKAKQNTFSWLSVLPALIAASVAKQWSTKLITAEPSPDLIAIIAGVSFLFAGAITYSVCAEILNTIRSKYSARPIVKNVGITFFIVVVSTILLTLVPVTKSTSSKDVKTSNAVSSGVSNPVTSLTNAHNKAYQSDTTDAVIVTRQNAFSNMMSEPNENKIFIGVTTESAYGMTSEEWGTDMLNSQLQSLVDTSTEKAYQEFIKLGGKPGTFHPMIQSNAFFSHVDNRKFGVFMIERQVGNLDSHTIRVTEVANGNVVSVGCVSFVAMPSISSGPCADKIRETFHVSLPSR